MLSLNTIPADILPNDNVPIRNNIEQIDPGCGSKFSKFRKTKKWKAIRAIFAGVSVFAGLYLPVHLLSKANELRELEKAILAHDLFKNMIVRIFNKIKYPFDEHFSLHKISILPEGVYIEMTQTAVGSVSFVQALSKQLDLGIALRHSQNKNMKITLVQEENDYSKNTFMNGVNEYQFKVQYANPIFTDKDYSYEQVGKSKVLNFKPGQMEITLAIDNSTFADTSNASVITLEYLGDFKNQEELFIMVELF